MDAELANEHVVTAGLRHLSPNLNTPPARAMLLAIALQESGFRHRVQLIADSRHWWESLRGPARGWWQFERAGVQGVLDHYATRDTITKVLERLAYPRKAGVVHKALAHNDALATVFARMLLYTVPEALPKSGDAETAWNQYLFAWRPGKPHRERWDENYAEGWRIATTR